ncbi:thymidine kinase, partial [Vibrio parahaemolyticus]|nr:thymidine kinase [Vibrio parahaemolyticus]
YKTLAFKPVVDTRFKTADIISHDDISIEAILVENIESIKLHCEANIPDVIAIDEIQFLGGEIKDIIDSINNFLERDITVIVAGLDVDFEGRPFEIVKELMPIADYLTKHHAVCVKCGSDAWISHR